MVSLPNHTNALDLIRARFGVNAEDHSPICLRASRHRELLQLWHDLDYREIVEVGTEEGRFAEEICRANPQTHLTCIDPYLAYDRYTDHVEQSRLDRFYKVAQQRMAKYNCTILRMTSLEYAAVCDPGTVDAVFIDGNHHFDFVVRDIIAWAPIVRAGGIVSGHDYKPEGQEKTPIPFGVIEAVNAYTAAHKIAPWFVLKGDKCPTWMWVRD